MEMNDVEQGHFRVLGLSFDLLVALVFCWLLFVASISVMSAACLYFDPCMSRVIALSLTMAICC